VYVESQGQLKLFIMKEQQAEFEKYHRKVERANPAQ
jgi:hypothetical protein